MGTLDLVKADVFDIKYYLNDDILFAIAVTQDDVPVDLSGEILVMQVKKYKTSDEVLLEFSTADGTIVASSVSPFKLTFSNEGSAYSGKTGINYHDLKKDSSNKAIFYGKFTVRQDVTRES